MKSLIPGFGRMAPRRWAYVAALATLPAGLIGCATTVQPGPYEITAYDSQGQRLRSANIAVTDSRSLSVPMNGFCIAYPKAKLIVRPKEGQGVIERQC